MMSDYSGVQEPMIDLSKTSSLMGWPETRKAIEAALREALGKMPKHPQDSQIKVIEENETRGITRKRVIFSVTDDETVSGWLFSPDGKEEVPGILCCHGLTPHGKDEPAGFEGNHRLAFAQHYAERGYATLAVDMPAAGERTPAKREHFDADFFHKENPGMSLAAKALSDHMQAVGVFAEVKRVDATRIGVIGHGLGGFNALLLAAFDDRVQACVASSAFTRLATDKTPGQWPGSPPVTLVPKFSATGPGGSFPLDWEHILALAAPTAVQVITSLSNSIHTNPKSCQKAVTLAGKIYKLLGAQSALDLYTHHDGEDFTPETLDVADEWFERWL